MGSEDKQNTKNFECSTIKGKWKGEDCLLFNALFHKVELIEYKAEIWN